jgi:uncharacterized membrane protein YvlD (DUF360 family)
MLVALAVLAVAAVALIAVSALDGPLGYTALGLAVVAAIVLAVRRTASLGALARELQWPIVLLTAALFVIVTAVDNAGALGWTRTLIERAPPLGIGWALAIASNLANNLPIGLNAGHHPAPTRSGEGLRRTHRRESRPEPIGERVAGHDPVARDRPPQRGASLAALVLARGPAGHSGRVDRGPPAAR